MKKRVVNIKIKIFWSAFGVIPLLTSCANPNASKESYENTMREKPFSFEEEYNLDELADSVKSVQAALNKGENIDKDDLSPFGRLIKEHSRKIQRKRRQIKDRGYRNNQEIKIIEKFIYKNKVCELDTIAYSPKINPKDYYKDYYISTKHVLDPWNRDHFWFYDEVAFLESEGCGEFLQQWAKESHLNERLLLRPKGYRNLRIKFDNEIKINSKISMNTLFDKILADYDPDKNDKIFDFQQPLAFSSIDEYNGKVHYYHINTGFSIIGEKAQEDLKNNMKENVDYYRNSINKTLKNLIKTRNYGHPFFTHRFKLYSIEEKGFGIKVLEKSKPKQCGEENYKSLWAKADSYYYHDNIHFYLDDIKEHLKEDVTYQEFNDAFWIHLAYKYFSKKEANQLLSYWTRHKVPPIIRGNQSSRYLDQKCASALKNTPKTPILLRSPKEADKKTIPATDGDLRFMEYIRKIA